MKKTFFIIICFLLLDIISSGQTTEASKLKVRGNPIYYVDGIKVIQSLDTTKLAIFYKDNSTITQAQIKTADSILINVVNYYNSQIDKKQIHGDSIVLSYGSADKIDLEKYCRQYTVRILKDNTINVDAYCFCEFMVEGGIVKWRKTPIKIHDGGSCVFSVTLDLNKGQGRMMRVNGQ